jgi:hypothetical protein
MGGGGMSDWYLWSMGVPKELGPQGHFTQGSAHVLLASSQYLMLAQWSSTSHSRIGTQIPTASHMILGHLVKGRVSDPDPYPDPHPDPH